VLARVALSSRPDHATAGQWEDELRSVLRATDVAWIDRDRLTLLLPEVSGSQARFGIARVAAALGDRAQAHAARIVVFPDDGITLAGLLDALADPRGDQSPPGRPRTVGKGVKSVP
jgi:hypothetical protein